MRTKVSVLLQIITNDKRKKEPLLHKYRSQSIKIEGKNHHSFHLYQKKIN